MSSKKFSDYNGTSPEVNFHSDFIQYLKNNNFKYKAWGSAGPDLFLEDFDVIGELKKSLKQTKSAIDEIFARPDDNKFSIKKYDRFFIAGADGINVYKRIKQSNEVSDEREAFDLINPISFQVNEIQSFLEYVRNNFNKIKADNHLEYILDLLFDEKFELTVSDILTIILHINEPYIVTNKSIIFNPGDENEIDIVVKNKKDSLFLKHNLLEKYYIDDVLSIKEYIKHNFSTHMPEGKKANLGKYYTPKELVEIVKNMISGYINEDTYLMDLSCGCGAFLELFEDTHIIGRDIDRQAIEVLDTLGFVNIAVDNSLANVSRSKFGLSDNDDIVIVGNPPYNHTTSKNKRYGTTSKTKDNTVTNKIKIDEDIRSVDLGRSFLRAYAKLNPKSMCLIHPLSYLIKKVNFNNLKEFSDKYRLKDAIVVPSSMFKDLKGKSEFPICIALYEQGSMDFNYICNYEFKLFNRDFSLCINKIETIDDNNYICKYPKKYKVDGVEYINKSEINLYMYNIRDTNALVAGSNLNSDIELTNTNYISINFEDLYKYSYLFCMKILFDNDFTTGNLSPLVNQHELENSQYLKDLFIIATIMKNQRLSPLNIKNKNSILYTKFLDNDFKKRAKEVRENTLNIYNLFQEFKELYMNGDCVEHIVSPIENEIRVYFNKLKENAFRY